MSWEKFLKIEKEFDFGGDRDSEIRLIGIDTNSDNLTAYVVQTFYQGAIPSYHLISKDLTVKTIMFEDYHAPFNAKPKKEIPQMPINHYADNNASRLPFLSQSTLDNITSSLEKIECTKCRIYNWTRLGENFDLIGYSKLQPRWTKHIAIIEHQEMPLSDLIWGKENSFTIKKIHTMQQLGFAINIIPTYYKPERLYVSFKNNDKKDKLIVFRFQKDKSRG